MCTSQRQMRSRSLGQFGWTALVLTNSVWRSTAAALSTEPWDSVWPGEPGTSACWLNPRRRTSAGAPSSPWSKVLCMTASVGEEWRKRKTVCASSGVFTKVYMVSRSRINRIQYEKWSCFVDNFMSWKCSRTHSTLISQTKSSEVLVVNSLDFLTC